MTAQLQSKQGPWKSLLVGILVAQLTTLALRIVSKFVLYLYCNSDILSSTLNDVMGALDVVHLIAAAATCLLLFMWSREVPQNDKLNVTMLSVAMLIPTIWQLVITLPVFVSSLKEKIWGMEYIDSIRVAIFWMSFAILTFALYSLSRTQMVGRVKKGLKSLYSYCVSYLWAAFVGPIIIAIGFIIIALPYANDMGVIFEKIFDYAGVYITSGNISGIFDQFYNSMIYSAVSDIEMPFSFILEMLEDMIDSEEPNVLIGAMVVLVGALISFLSYVLSLIFYYRGFILLAMSDRSVEDGAQVAESVDEVIDTEIE